MPVKTTQSEAYIQMAILKLVLPWPPTANTYYRHVGSRVLISARGRAYRKAVADAVLMHQAVKGAQVAFGGLERLAVTLDCYPPDKRKRDLDNLQKPLLDGLEWAGVFPDDGQIDLLITKRHPSEKPGRVTVIVEAIS